MPSDQPLRVLFCVHIRAHFPEMHRTACRMLENGRFLPAILFTGVANFSDESEVCRQSGVEWIPSSTSSTRAGEGVAQAAFGNDDSPGLQRLRSFPFLGKLLRSVWSVYARCVITKSAVVCLPWHLSNLGALRRTARRLLDQVHPAVVVVPHVEIGRLLGAITSEAQHRGLIAIVIPYTWVQRTETVNVIRGRRDRQIRGWFGRSIARRYPHWASDGLLCLPAVRILAMEWLQFSSGSPWMPDNAADAIALESQAMLQSYLGDGCESTRCRLTGSAAHDVMSRSKRGRSPDGEYALCFLPSDQTGLHMPGFEFRSYREMLCFWIETLLRNNPEDVLFSLHPRMKELKRPLTQRYPNLRIHDGDSCEAIPDARYCVGFFGGSLRYAISASRPVLHYDVFHYRLDKFAGVSSVVTVEDRAAFADAVERFSTDRLYLRRMQNEARVNAPYWGELDGRAVDRIEDLIDDLLRRRRRQAD